VSTPERSNLHELERELTRFFRRSRVASTAIAAEVHPDLDVASYTVLVTISDLSASLTGGVRAIDVAETLGLHKSTISARRQRVSTILSRWTASDVRDLARLLGHLNDDLASGQ